MENFLSDKISIEISFAKENLIDYRTENGYCFGFYDGSVECLHRRIEKFLSMNSHECRVISAIKTKIFF